jgi:hypothetical protein
VEEGQDRSSVSASNEISNTVHTANDIYDSTASPNDQPGPTPSSGGPGPTPTSQVTQRTSGSGQFKARSEELIAEGRKPSIVFADQPTSATATYAQHTVTSSRTSQNSLVFGGGRRSSLAEKEERARQSLRKRLSTNPFDPMDGAVAREQVDGPGEKLFDEWRCCTRAGGWAG